VLPYFADGSKPLISTMYMPEVVMAVLRSTFEYSFDNPKSYDKNEVVKGVTIPPPIFYFKVTVIVAGPSLQLKLPVKYVVYREYYGDDSITYC
jgi:hypothetical protein